MGNKINVFDYIEEACAVLDANAVGFAHAADKLTEYLEATFGCMDAAIAITSRIKTRDSLKEKILRNSLYKECEAKNLVFRMHDIIGVRIECRFFKDEVFFYDKIREVFGVNVGDGYFSPVGKKAIKLKLDTPQPERQKNGFHIYRIDGSVAYAGEDYNFELQIKSLVNTFWSEIEHKLIYKNIRYSPADMLMKELLNSIHESLSGVDHQLNLIFDRLNGNALGNQQAQLVSMITAGINEIYTAVIKRSTGIDVSITEYSEAIVLYLLNASSYIKNTTGVSLRKAVRDSITGEETDDGEGDTNYSGLFISLMDWMRKIDYCSINVGEKIDIPMPDGVNEDVANVFLKSVNDDFYLNTFFHIYFSLERGDDSSDFADYIRYYTDRILGGKTQDGMYRTLARLYDTPAHKLPLEKTIKMLEEIN